MEGRLGPRPMGAVNWIGLWTLLAKEVRRFTKVHAQTVTAPLLTTILFYVVFALALGGNDRMMNGIPYMTFLAPGLIMMSMAQNAFANTSSSLVISKVQGNIVDVLMPPLSPLEFTLGYVLGGVARGLIVGVVGGVALSIVSDLSIVHPFFVVFHAMMGAMMLSLLGVLGGLWSEKFDHMATVQNFIIMPATFLSGTFYASRQLPGAWQLLCHMNPFFYMIDGFRYGFTGIADAPVMTGLVVMIGINIAFFILSYVLIARGYRLKS